MKFMDRYIYYQHKINIFIDFYTFFNYYFILIIKYLFVKDFFYLYFFILFSLTYTTNSICFSFQFFHSNYMNNVIIYLFLNHNSEQNILNLILKHFIEQTFFHEKRSLFIFFPISN